MILDPKYNNAGKEINGSKALEKFSYIVCDGGHQKYSLHVISPLNSISKLLIFKILSVCINLYYSQSSTNWRSFNLVHVSQC